MNVMAKEIVRENENTDLLGEKGGGEGGEEVKRGLNCYFLIIVK